MSDTDIDLLSRWSANGDAQAFNHLVSQYAGHVYGTCKRILRSDADAQEAAQECFIKLAESKPQIHSSLAAWLHTVATNISLSHLRSDSRRKERERAYAQNVRTPAEPVWDDVQEFIDQAIEELPDELRTAIVACFLERKTHNLIAEQAGVDRSTVTRRIDRGVEKIREALDKKGISTTAAVLPGMFETNLNVTAPASLAAKLGKIAISGGRVRTLQSASAKHSTHAGGITTMGKVVVGSLVAGAAVLALWLGLSNFRSDDSTQNLPEPTQIATTPNEESVIPTQSPDVDSSDALPLSQSGSIVTAANQESPQPSGMPITDAFISGRVYAKSNGDPLPDVTVSAQKLDAGGDAEPIKVITQTNGDSRFRNLARSALRLDTGDAEPIEVITQENGEYQFPNLSPGEYRIRCEMPDGFLGVDDGGLVRTMSITSANQQLPDVDFSLLRGGVLNGTVVTLGKPVRNAAVSIASYVSDGDVGDTGLIRTPIETDGSGKFRVEGLLEFDGMLMARRTRDDGSKQEALAVVASIRLDEEITATFDFVAGQSSIEGTVTHGVDEVPMLAEIQVIFTWLENGDYNEESYRLRTDGLGRYQIGNLPAGYVKFHVWPTGAIEQGAQVASFRLEESEHKVHDINFSEHVLNYHFANIPDWAQEVMIGIYPADFEPRIEDMAGFLEARDNTVSGERIKRVTSPNISKELKGLEPGSYTVGITVWPVHYNMGAIQKFGGVKKVIEKMIKITDHITIHEGSPSDELYFDFAEYVNP